MNEMHDGNLVTKVLSSPLLPKQIQCDMSKSYPRHHTSSKKEGYTGYAAWPSYYIIWSMSSVGTWKRHILKGMLKLNFFFCNQPSNWIHNIFLKLIFDCLIVKLEKGEFKTIVPPVSQIIKLTVIGLNKSNHWKAQKLQAEYMYPSPTKYLVDCDKRFTS